MVDPVSLATAARIVGTVFFTAFGGRPSKQQQQRLAAASSQGYRPGPGGVFRTPDGGAISKRDVLKIGAGILAAQAGTVVQMPKRGSRGRSPPPPPRAPGGAAPPPPPPRQPGPFETGVGVGAGATFGAAVLQSLPPVVQWVWNEAQQRWEMRGKDLRKGPTRRYRRMTVEDKYRARFKRELERLRREQPWSGNVTLPPIGGVRPVSVPDVPLEEIKVPTARLPVPAIPPLPAGYRIFKAVVTRAGIPGAARYYNVLKPLAPLAVTLATEQLKGGKKKRKQPKEQPALTPTQSPGVGYIQQPFASFAVQPAAEPATVRKCKPCKKPKKRGPRKPRSVCYRGTYTETRKGLSKFKREQIPCR